MSVFRPSKMLILISMDLYFLKEFNEDGAAM
jgi:hypothetical protein